jgi:hypothetical protein
MMEEEKAVENQIIDSERIKEEIFVNLMVQIVVRLTLKDCHEQESDSVPKI